MKVVVKTITLTSANDAPERDPENFEIQGSKNGTDWTTLQTWQGQLFTARFEKKEYTFQNEEPYSFYRLNTTKNRGEVAFTQIAEVELLGPPFDGNLSVNNTSEISSFLLYPNPSIHGFHVNTLDEGIVRILNVSGKVVYEQKIKGNRKINPNLPAGIYLISMEVNGKSSLKKLILK